MNLVEARKAISSGNIEGRQFDILRLIAKLASESRHQNSARELILRVLDQPDGFRECRHLLDSLLRRVGLFPYAAPDNLSLPDLIAYEAHRPLDYDADVVFHEVQARVYGRLMSGENVILSAPTSFGKSLVLDAIVASGRYRNIAVILPTLALIDETRKRLSRFRDSYRLITHPSQVVGEKNLIILTQERLLELPEIPRLDFFMVDEFYKLDIRSGEVDRAVLLNQALQRLMRTEATFYLAGPNVHALADSLPPGFVASFISTDFATVVSDVSMLPTPRKGEELQDLVTLCSGLTGPTLIYCQSPASARKVARHLCDAEITDATPAMQDFSQWVGDNYHSDWLLCRAVLNGIGVHHGKIPRPLSQYQVSAFNEGVLKFLVCTSTLIEGVNTSAKNVVVYDHKLAKKRLDFFTFSNIKGRSGRMMRHFVGKVYLFRPPPVEDLPTVDVPLFSQGPDVPDSLLIQVDGDALLPQARERVSKYREQTEVAFAVLQSNSGLDPQAQVNLAQYVRRNVANLAPGLAWSGYPEYSQLEVCCDLILRFLHPRMGYGVRSARQLAFRINLTNSTGGDPQAMIMRQWDHGREDADEAVENVLEFLRHWPGFAFPRLLMALESIVRPILREAGYERCDYSAYAANSKGYFLPRFVAEVEDYGLPMQVTMKIMSRSLNAETIDDLLDHLRHASTSALGGFERDAYRAFVKFI